MRAVVVALSGLVLGSFGCSSSKSQGLPPATEWETGDPTAGAGAMPSKPRGGGGASSSDPHGGMFNGGGGADPHAGVPGAPPIAGGGGGSDPHAGIPGAPPIEGNMHGDPNAPQGDLGAAVDVTQLGLSSPDPNRPIDLSRSIKGVIKVGAKTKDRIKPGASIFLMVRKPTPDGQPTGTLIAVDKVTWTADGQGFELTEKHAMIAGGPDLVGELFVLARVDQDLDAMTKQPGDVTGYTRVKIPATGVTLELDTVLP